MGQPAAYQSAGPLAGLGFVLGSWPHFALECGPGHATSLWRAVARMGRRWIPSTTSPTPSSPRSTAAPAARAGRDRPRRPHVERNGRRLLSFSCNDYLNLTHHPAIKAAAIAALERHGVGAGASRLVTGNHPLYAELEARLARLKGTEAACVFGSGYLANAGIIPALVGPDDLVLLDELSHACLWAGARLARATVLAFRHNDVGHAGPCCARIAAASARLDATDGVFSMDGDLAPLAELGRLARRYDAWLMSDDAHGIGVLGGGRGSTFAGAEPVDVPLQMGTLSKAIGAYGGYLCASRPVIDLMNNRARTLIYSTGLPPAIVAAAIAALDLIEREPDYAALPLAKARAFTRRAGLPEAQSPIVPVVVGSAQAALAASRRAGAQASWWSRSGRRPSRTAPRGCASPSRPGIRTTTSSASPTSCASRCAHERDLRHRDRHRHRQDLRGARAHPRVAARGRAVAALKPVVSGFDPAAAARSDTGLLLAALGRPVTPRNLAHLALAVRGAALARHGGGARGPRARHRGADRVLPRRDREPRRRAADRRRRRRDGPLDARHTVLDWMSAWAPAGAGRRQLSRYHQPHPDGARRARPPQPRRRGLVVSETAGSPVRLDETRDTIARFAPASIRRPAAPCRADSIIRPSIGSRTACSRSRTGPSYSRTRSNLSTKRISAASRHPCRPGCHIRPGCG